MMSRGGQARCSPSIAPCCTFFRARHAGGRGPAPLRSARYPRGLPWLSAAARKTVTEANLLVDFTAEVLEVQMRTLGRAGLLEHPEDLGNLQPRQGAPGGCPASIWRWPSIMALLEFAGVDWGALCQTDFGTSYLKPTRLLTNLQKSSDIISLGEPIFDVAGKYLGPLAPRARPDGQEKLIGRQDGSFRTSATAAWPPKLCESIADKIMAMMQYIDEKTDKVPSEGEVFKNDVKPSRPLAPLAPVQYQPVEPLPHSPAPAPQAPTAPRPRTT